jgi:hypothetical protein
MLSWSLHKYLNAHIRNKHSDAVNIGSRGIYEHFVISGENIRSSTPNGTTRNQEVSDIEENLQKLLSSLRRAIFD